MMITEAETTWALATTCGGRPLQEGPPWPPLLGNVCAVSSPQPARLPGLCHAGGTGLGLPGQCSRVLSCPSSGLEEPPCQLIWPWAWPALRGDGGFQSRVTFSTQICKQQEFHRSGFKEFKERVFGVLWCLFLAVLLLGFF